MSLGVKRDHHYLPLGQESLFDLRIINHGYSLVEKWVAPAFSYLVLSILLDVKVNVISIFLFTFKMKPILTT